MAGTPTFPPIKTNSVVDRYQTAPGLQPRAAGLPRATARMRANRHPAERLLWRFVADSALEGNGFEPVWGFSCQSCFWFWGFLARSGKVVPRPVAYDQVRGARGLPGRQDDGRRLERFGQASDGLHPLGTKSSQTLRYQSLLKRTRQQYHQQVAKLLEDCSSTAWNLNRQPSGPPQNPAGDRPGNRRSASPRPRRKPTRPLPIDASRLSCCPFQGSENGNERPPPSSPLPAQAGLMPQLGSRSECESDQP
jgi:hypothetical protein